MAGLYTYRDECKTAAGRLGDYQNIGVTELADGYCKALDEGNTELQNSYMAALVLRYWYKIDRLYKENPSLNLQREDYSSLIYERVRYACKYRVWQTKPNIKASQAIQQSIATGIKNEYYFANLEQSCANYKTVSLEALESDGDEDDMGSRDWLENRFAEPEHQLSSAEAIVQTFLDKNKIVQAILLDRIAFDNSSRETKRSYTQHYTEVVKNNKTGEDVEVEQTYACAGYSHSFLKGSITKIVKALPDNYQAYFLNKYNIKKEIFEAGLAAIKTARNQKLYKYMEAALQDIRSNPNLISLLRD